jgi:uncharacterized protein (TIGR03083 family)
MNNVDTGPMETAAFRRHLEREITSYDAGLRLARANELWDAPVSSCPGWTIRDLTEHLIGIHYWVLDAIGGKGGTELERPPATDDRLPDAFLTSTDLLLTALDQDPETPCWTFGDRQSLSFWQRRQPHEHQIHRWDLETALGHAATLDSELASDGVDEVVTFFWPRQITLGRTAEPFGQLALRVTGSERSWLLGNLTSTSEPVASLSGSAEDLLLALWKRLPADAATLTWSGDIEAGRAILAQKLVP